MSERFHLETGTKKYVCPWCQGGSGSKRNAKTFRRYVDSHNNNDYLHEKVGRCDRQENCSQQNYSPSDYFKDGGDVPEGNPDFVPKAVKPVATSYIKSSYARSTMAGGAFRNSDFYTYIKSISDTEIADSTFKKYGLGAAQCYGEACVIFWQVDKEKKIRTGKVMAYNPETGKRIKDEGRPQINWIHALNKIDGVEFNLKQCYFGEHLLANTTKNVGVVESEKTAVVCSIFYPDIVWIATGGLSNIRQDKCQCLRGKNVLFFPDLGCLDTWRLKVDNIRGLKSSTVVDSFEKNAEEFEIASGYDLEDYIKTRNVELDKVKFWAHNTL